MTRTRSPERWSLLLLVIAVSLACQVVPTPPPLSNTPRGRETPSASAPQLEPASSLPAAGTGTPDPAAPASLPTSPGDLPPFPYQPGAPFANLPRPAWQASETKPVETLSLPVAWGQVLNPEVAAGLTSQQRSRLAQDGFVILHSQEPRFSDIRERVALRYGQPYYLTTDAAYDALRLTLDELLITLEKEELRRRVYAVTQETLAETLSYLKQVPGGALEADIRQAAAYLGVGLRLLDPQAPIDPAIEGPVNDQVEQILAGRGMEASVLIPGFQDDFSAYRPAGHYAGDPNLEAYFRAMAWYSRVVFRDEPGSASPSRVPLILTLALRRGFIEDSALSPNPAQPLTAAQEWANVSETLSFLLGPSLDDGPPQYAALMDHVYGPGLTIVGLSDQRAFELLQLYVRELPPLQQEADPLAPFRAASAERGWRFLGYGFHLDDYLLRQLVASGGAEPAAQLHGGLDLFNLLGSPVAPTVLKEGGETGGAETAGSPARLQGTIDSLGPDFWSHSAPNAWLAALAAQATQKDPLYPAYMNSPAWGYKNLNSALGAWAGLRRGPRAGAVAASAEAQVTQPEGALVSAPPPGYVEPAPEVFYRLSHLANSTAEGLSQRGMTGIFTTNPNHQGLKSLLLDLLDLGDRLQRLGDIAARELEGQPPARDDWGLILAPLGPAEERSAPWPLPPAGIAALEPVGERSLRVATGWIDRIYTLVPMDGGLFVAQGGVSSYYELSGTSTGSLSDEEWLRRLNGTPPPEPVLAQALHLPGGNPVDVLVLRIGDAYRLLPLAGRLNLRAAPDRFARVVRPLRPGDAFVIIAGPVQASDLTWWQVRLPLDSGQPVEGWLVGDPALYERLW
jgi:hypothetical protein